MFTYFVWNVGNVGMNETSFLGKLVPNSFILPQIIENGNLLIPTLLWSFKVNVTHFVYSFVKMCSNAHNSIIKVIQ